MILLVKPIIPKHMIQTTVTTRIIDGQWFGVMIYADGTTHQLTIGSLRKKDAENRLYGWLQCTGVGNVWQEPLH